MKGRCPFPHNDNINSTVKLPFIFSIVCTCHQQFNSLMPYIKLPLYLWAYLDRMVIIIACSVHS